MSRRNKSRLEKWFSFSRHKKKLGAKKISAQILTDYAQQKITTINNTETPSPPVSTNSLEGHFEELRKEFSGKTEFHYTHAKTIVLIRREYKTTQHFQLFERLWQQEKKFLLKNLDIRWLISATDTFADHSPDAATRALALACSCLINTIKIQETERFFQHAETRNDDEHIIKQLQEDQHNLFDGITTFAVGTGDTLRNMRWRIDKMAKTNVAGEILLEIFLRLQQSETVYHRFLKRHIRNKTEWW